MRSESDLKLNFGTAMAPTIKSIAAGDAIANGPCVGRAWRAVSGRIKADDAVADNVVLLLNCHDCELDSLPLHDVEGNW